MSRVIVIAALVGLICGCRPSEIKRVPHQVPLPITDQNASDPPMDSQESDRVPNPALEVKHVNGAEAVKMVKEDPDVIVLDIRTLEEFQSGHIADALNIDYKASDFEEKLGQLDRHKTYLVH
ncbi:MAG TPA: rhodanese-like domain-containing protein [Verrucomicrobiales bacterium]|jgi:hypothetical protein|nr:rhodanese-like domain-containing protein [Verrucomicrobiales bacterium]HIL70300.1 rhodanese-like domain-containing protein [Verrucomicrobiota bacterium]